MNRFVVPTVLCWLMGVRTSKPPVQRRYLFFLRFPPPRGLSSVPALKEQVSPNKTGFLVHLWPTIRCQRVLPSAPACPRLITFAACGTTRAKMISFQPPLMSSCCVAFQTSSWAFQFSHRGFYKQSPRQASQCSRLRALPKSLAYCGYVQ